MPFSGVSQGLFNRKRRHPKSDRASRFP
jgi:hypothetical protein